MAAGMLVPRSALESIDGGGGGAAVHSLTTPSNGLEECCQHVVARSIYFGFGFSRVMPSSIRHLILVSRSHICAARTNRSSVRLSSPHRDATLEPVGVVVSERATVVHLVSITAVSRTLAQVGLRWKPTVDTQRNPARRTARNAASNDAQHATPHRHSNRADTSTVDTTQPDTVASSNDYTVSSPTHRNAAETQRHTLLHDAPA